MRRLMNSSRSTRFSGVCGPTVWSYRDVTTSRIMRVKLMPNRLMPVNTLRRSSTFQAIFRYERSIVFLS